MEFLIRYKCAKILFLHKSLFSNQLEILSHVVIKQEVKILQRSYFKEHFQPRFTLFSSPEHNVLKWSFLGGDVSIVRCASSTISLTHSHTVTPFDTLKIYNCRKHCNKQVILFSQCFLPYMTLIFHCQCTLKCRLQFLSIWTSLKFFRLVMG